MSINYQLTKDDYIEAAQIHLSNTDFFGLYLLTTVILISSALISLWQIKNPYFLVAGQLKNNVVAKTTMEYIQDSLWSLGFALYFAGQNLPKYNPIYRWNLSKEYQKNFVRQENKNVAIADSGISIASDNYHDSRQWQDFTKYLENKHIFVLYGSRNKIIIIPKRAFTEQSQLAQFYTVLNVKIK